MDCDRAMLLIARRRARTLTGREIAHLGGHIDSCAACTELASETDPGDWIWVARVPEDALDDPDLGVLPTVEPALFDIEGPIARGGMGQILKARDRRLGRTVAIKEVLDDGLLDRFKREAMVTARLQHPAIVPIYEAGTWMGGSAFYTMRLVAGDTLSAAIRSRENPPDRLALLPNLITVTEALAYAHSEGIVHRDLKPSNVLLGDFGETVVIDWGLAKILGEAEDPLDPGQSATSPALTYVGDVLGTPCYIAPEQALGELCGPAADVYSLGAILYTLLCGVPPFLDTHDEATANELIELVIASAPTPIATLAPSAPDDLIAICDRAMAHSATDRFETAAAMAAELRKFEAGQLIASKSYTLRELATRWLARHRALVLVSLAFLAVLIVGATLAVRGIVSSRDEARSARDDTARALVRQRERSSELVFRQAEAALAADPTKAVAWLKQFPESGEWAQGAAFVAAEALSRGVVRDVFVAPDHETERLSFIDGDTKLLATAGYYHGARVWDLKTGVATNLATLIEEDVFYNEGTKEFVGPSKKCLPLRVESLSGAARRIDWPGGVRPNCRMAAQAGRLAIPIDKQRVVLWDRKTEAFSELPLPGWPIAFVGADELLVAGKDNETLEWWKLPGGERLGSIVHTDDVASTRELDFGAVSPDGAIIAIRLDVGLLIWRRGQVATERWLPSEKPRVVRFSPSGDALVIGLASGVVVVLDLSGAALCRRWRADTAAVSALEFAGDDRLAVGTASGDVVIASRCGRVLRRLRGHSGTVRQLAISRRGDQLASVSADQTVRVSSLGGPLPRSTRVKSPAPPGCDATGVELRGGVSWFHCTSDGPDQLMSDGGARVEVTSWYRISGDGKTIATGSGERGSIDVWRSDARWQLPIPNQLVSLSHDGRRLFHAKGDSVEVWDVDRKVIVQTLAHKVRVAVPSPDGLALAVDGIAGIGVIDSRGESWAPEHLEQEWLTRWSVDSQLVGFQIREGALLVFDRVSRAWIRLSVRGGIHDFAISSSGRLVAASLFEDALVVWDLATGALHRLPFPKKFHYPKSVISKDGRRVTAHAVPESRTFELPTLSRARLIEATRAVIGERGELRNAP